VGPLGRGRRHGRGRHGDRPRGERRGAIIRTGHHSAHSGEFRDAAGFVAAKFLQHTSRSGDPQLHVQIPILNRAQRADGADEQWRALDGRPLWAERMGAVAYVGVAEAQELARLGFPLVKRPDGNGFEIGGIEQKTMDAFSARSAAIAAKLAERIAEYQEMFGHPPNRQALFKLRKRVTVETRAAKRRPAAAKQGDSAAQAKEAEKGAGRVGAARLR
jgi:conjugative relaxase-like TrwC/TraI family protein